MNILKHGDSRVVRIISSKKLNHEDEYRFSLFTYLYSEGNRFFIRNTLSLEVVELTEDEWKAAEKIKYQNVNGEYIEESRLEQLVFSGCIVKTDFDDIGQYQQAVFIMKMTGGNKKGIRTYTIFPTTGCNARCIYCYEEGYIARTMSHETADRLVDFICETRQDDKIKLRWFGGEPLAGADIIRRICLGLKERGVPYRSTMVTNAALMTKELAHEAKEIWNLEKVQVSLDGAREDYTKRKNYYDSEKHNYDVVMKAIHYLADEDIKVRMRVNVDLENIERIPDFLNDIKNEFPDTKNISLYFSPLFQAQQGDGCIELYRKIFRAYDIQSTLKIPKGKKGDGSTGVFRTNFCIADVVEKSITITPDGSFNNCEHLPQENSWGNIFEGVTDKNKYDELCAQAEIDEKCRACPFLPECTPFYKTGCRCWFEKCREYRSLKTEYIIHDLIKGENAENNDDYEKL